jgi:hypothetical protein
MDTTPRPLPQPMTTVEEIDEALTHTSKARHRNEHWQRWADQLLDERNRIAKETNGQRVARVQQEPATTSQLETNQATHPHT